MRSGSPPARSKHVHQLAIRNVGTPRAMSPAAGASTSVVKKVGVTLPPKVVGLGSPSVPPSMLGTGVNQDGSARAVSRRCIHDFSASQLSIDPPRPNLPSTHAFRFYSVDHIKMLKDVGIEGKLRQWLATI